MDTKKEIIGLLKEHQKEHKHGSDAYNALRKVEVSIPGIFESHPSPKGISDEEIEKVANKVIDAQTRSKLGYAPQNYIRRYAIQCIKEFLSEYTHLPKIEKGLPVLSEAEIIEYSNKYKGFGEARIAIRAIEWAISQLSTEGIPTGENILKEIYKHLDTLPYAGGYPSDYRETLSVHIAKWLSPKELGKKEELCKCKPPTGRTVDKDFRNICDTCRKPTATNQ